MWMLPRISQNLFSPLEKVFRNSWQRPHDERYDNGELIMLTLLWKYWVIYEQSQHIYIYMTVPLQ